jgi:hypothetical protein
MKSRERLTDIILSFDEGAVIYGYRLNGESIEFFGKDREPLKPSYAAMGAGYERDSGKYKSTTRVTVDPQHISANVPVWVTSYDRVFAVDTNTISLDGEDLSVTCCIRADIEFVENTWNARIEPIDALVVSKPRLKPELIGWLDVISRINTDPSLKIGLVVDSELGMLPNINLRKVPIANNIFLPQNVELVYASSDHDKTVPFNFLIAKCDSDASLLINKIVQDRSRLAALIPSEGNYYEASYYWQPKRLNSAQPIIPPDAAQ